MAPAEKREKSEIASLSSQVTKEETRQFCIIIGIIRKC
jgi:hypothetical protein